MKATIRVDLHMTGEGLLQLSVTDPTIDYPQRIVMRDQFYLRAQTHVDNALRRVLNKFEAEAKKRIR